MTRVRVKFCGITRPEDAAEAARLGVDAIGLVFYAGSPRAVTAAQARQVLDVLAPFVSKVGLFVNAQRGEIDRILSAISIDFLQFHGDETPEQCRLYGKPYIKAIRMRPNIDVSREASRYEDATALLLDAYQEGIQGGTGTSFDWARVPHDLHKPVILAGGLTPANVAAAIAQVRPYAVDVSGGIEAARGVKDPAKMREFIQEVQRGCS